MRFKLNLTSQLKIFMWKGGVYILVVFNLNISPLFRGDIFWMDPMNATIREATFYLDPILRQHAGVYTCFVELHGQ